MFRLRSTAAILAGMLLAAACSESPTAPAAVKPVAIDSANSIITPFLLPPGADWGQYFISFNRDRYLTARVIHYPNGVVTGNGQFLIPGAKSGGFRIYAAAPYGGCVPNGSACGSVTNIPESDIVTGIAFFYTGGSAPIKIDMYSNYWPNPTNTFDTATLSFCTDYTYATCPVSYYFFGELHHEPQ